METGLGGSCDTAWSPLGESIPVAKTPLPQAHKDAQPWQTNRAEDWKRHLLFCGTEIVQARGDGDGPAKAVVLRTGGWMTC